MQAASLTCYPILGVPPKNALSVPRPLAALLLKRNAATKLAWASRSRAYLPLLILSKRPPLKTLRLLLTCRVVSLMWKLCPALFKLSRLLLLPWQSLPLFLTFSASKPPKHKLKHKPHKAPLAVLAPPVKRESARLAAKLPLKVSPELPPDKALPAKVRVRVARRVDWAGGLLVQALWVTCLRSAILMPKLLLTRPSAILVQP